MHGYHGRHNVFVDHAETVEVTITNWDNSSESGVGILGNGTEVTVFQSYDGDGFLVLSDHDATAYKLAALLNSYAQSSAEIRQIPD